jgi:hypothetical protein
MPIVKKGLFLVFLCKLLVEPALAFEFDDIDLPKEHIPFYFKTFPQVAEECRNDESCPFKVFLIVIESEILVMNFTTHSVCFHPHLFDALAVRHIPLFGSPTGALFYTRTAYKLLIYF